jgi:photosystem I P700 chlorophyll a apoprotein A1
MWLNQLVILGSLIYDYNSARTRSKLKKAQVLVDLDVVETSFEKWAKPGHFSRTLQKVQNNNMDLNLHADAHDFDANKIFRRYFKKIFSAHFGQLAIIFLWISGMHFHGAYFSNYTAWLMNPLQIKPSAQSVWYGCWTRNFKC